CCFFFSSRRRHTRSYGDWSSDVCSSDLIRRARRNERRTAEVNLRRAQGIEAGRANDRARRNDDRPGTEVSIRKSGHLSGGGARRDRKSTRLNSSHRTISYAVSCLKNKAL